MKQTQRNKRRGAVTVEFAIMAPVFLGLVVGVTETAHMFDMQNQLQVAAREGARMASMDRSGMVAAGQSTNTKVIQDVKNYLKATGIDPNQVNVQIVSHENPSQAFNLDSQSNSLKYFDLKITTPFTTYGAPTTPVPGVTLETKIVFRNARVKST